MSRIVAVWFSVSGWTTHDEFQVGMSTNWATQRIILSFQYVNPGNPAAHYDHTGVEILNQCGGQLDMIVVGAGTGGAISGLGRKMKDCCSNCLVIGVDPGTSAPDSDTMSSSSICNH